MKKIELLSLWITIIASRIQRILNKRRLRRKLSFKLSFILCCMFVFNFILYKSSVVAECSTSVLHGTIHKTVEFKHLLNIFPHFYACHRDNILNCAMLQLFTAPMFNCYWLRYRDWWIGHPRKTNSTRKGNNIEALSRYTKAGINIGH
jgi:predicted PurR-regulated permease PerM